MDDKEMIQELKLEIKAQHEYIRALEEECRLLKQVQGGRLSRFNYETRMDICNKRLSGQSINKLAQEYNCSTSVISRIIKGIDIDLRKKQDMKTFDLYP